MDEDEGDMATKREGKERMHISIGAEKDVSNIKSVNVYEVKTVCCNGMCAREG